MTSADRSTATNTDSGVTRCSDDVPTHATLSDAALGPRGPRTAKTPAFSALTACPIRASLFSGIQSGVRENRVVASVRFEPLTLGRDEELQGHGSAVDAPAAQVPEGEVEVVQRRLVGGDRDQEAVSLAGRERVRDR